MVKTIPATEVTLRTLKQSLGLNLTCDPDFFLEWSDNLEQVGEPERELLSRVKTNFLELMSDAPLLENSVKMVVLAPLLDLAGFYRRPFRLETEASIDVEMEDEGLIIRGRIDVLIVAQGLWLVVIESKRSDFAVTRAIPQILAYMLGNACWEKPTFGMITNGNDFLFLKATRQPQVEYATSRLFSLINPNNDLNEVLAILRRLSQLAITL